MVEVLVNRGILQNIADIYKLEDPTLRIILKAFPGFGDKTVYEITKGVQTSRHQPLWRIINALGIPHVGDKMSQDIANFLTQQQVASLQQMRDILTDSEQLLLLPGIGEKTVLSLQNFFTHEQTRNTLKQLESHGLQFSVSPSQQTEPQKVKGTFSITGIFPLPRDTIKKQLEKS